MNTHGNSTHATITPQTGNAHPSEKRNNSKNAASGKGPELKTAKKTLKLDARLEPIRAVIESQPRALQVTLSDTAIAMLLATRKLRDKRAGIVHLTTTTDLYPRSANLQVKLDYPKELKDDEQTIQNVKEWDDFLKVTKDKLKAKILVQSERTAEFYQEQRLKTFHDNLLIIAEGYVTWHNEIAGVTDIPLSNHAYGAASVYCYYNTLAPMNEIFSYLCEEQDSLLKAFKTEHLTTAAGHPLFSDTQLQSLTLLMPEVEQHEALGTPRRLDTSQDADSKDSSTELGVPPPQPTPQSQLVTQDPPDGANGANADAAPAAPVAPANSDVHETHPVPQNLENVIYRVKDILYDIIPPLFLDIGRQIQANQAEKKADAKLEAALTKRKTLDVAKLLEADLANQSIVAPENMEALVNSLVDQRIALKDKQSKKALLQALRKKSLGGGTAAKPPPNKQKNGGKPKSILRNKRAPQDTPTQQQATKRPKKNPTQRPNEDYQRMRNQRTVVVNPYARTSDNNRNNNHTGRGYSSPGRGRGRGRSPGRGGRNSGRGRGRGRS
jgi:hypothetical protein